MARIIAILAIAVVLAGMSFVGCVGEQPGSTISGNATYGGAMIMAVPADGSASVSTVTGENNTYSLSVKPGVHYHLTCYAIDLYGQPGHVAFYHRNGSLITDIAVDRGETETIDANIFFPHPPKFLIMSRGPEADEMGFFKPAPVNISGHVYLDGKPVDGAMVEAMSVDDNMYMMRMTNEYGFYNMTIRSGYQYDLTATCQGMRHTVRPVHLYNNETGEYDIDLTGVPGTIIAGSPRGNDSILTRPGNIITAIPADGGEPIETVTAENGSYSLEVKPFVYYRLTGTCLDDKGKYNNLSFYMRTGLYVNGIIARPDETVWIDYHLAPPGY